MSDFRPSRLNTLNSSATIRVDNVLPSVSVHDLSDYFSVAGEVVDVQPLSSFRSDSHQYKIRFAEPRMAQCALHTLDGTSLHGCKIKTMAIQDEDTDTSHCSHRAGSPSSLDQLSLPDTTALQRKTISTGHEQMPLHYPKQGDFVPNQAKFQRSSNHTQRSVALDARNCNLYILNLSLDINNETLKSIVRDFGEIRHVCVLATLDNAGRRRAFVDMATPEEAHAVMRGLHGKRVHGYELHISYAFVQRSGGPSMNFNPGPSASAIEQARKFAFHGKHPNLSPRFAPESTGGFGPITRGGPPSSQGSNPAQTGGGLDGESYSACSRNRENSAIPFPSPTESSYSGSSGPAAEITNGSFIPSNHTTPSFGSEIFVYNISPVACIDTDDLLKWHNDQTRKSHHLTTTYHIATL
ncbi:uncharacterized protein MELLADRAFT_79336 [Melampsora larici-populina 98AG31]|uniref:RRM domain-containing protein n=1 Tax=Melampsora larici-populina (strain 98AG31 / pathotype 3-4-7) TaxID=747676 RepID=F4S5L6_MELLP|nr:uncharacterized protein MELLADRAFT_79336 [Melampsora larici-populina 98AG31]EGG00088.1 hypothetical protein MELLADRAFT_79336 [Melampsora larici-populina 98AG31]